MKQMMITQTDRFLKTLEPLKTKSRPKIGWIKYIRQSLGMTTSQLANRITVSRRRISKIEKDELTDVLTIKTLKAIANAMECHFVYAILPKTSIKQTIATQANKIAVKHLAKVTHHMNLEAQSVTDQKMLKLQLETIIQQYLNKSYKHLWDE